MPFIKSSFPSKTTCVEGNIILQFFDVSERTTSVPFSATSFNSLSLSGFDSSLVLATSVTPAK